MGAVAAEIAPHLAPGATVTDVGSVKRDVIAQVGPHLPEGVHFVPGHPLAGPSIRAAVGLRGAVRQPLRPADAGRGHRPGGGRAAARLWEGCGANVEEMDADHHDLVLAVTSHTPHLIAYTMVGVADDLRRVTDSEVIKYSAAGFRDFTRIAASDPTMWRDVFLTNKDATLEILGRFTEELFALQRAIRTGDGDHLHAYFTRTRAIRRGIIEAGQDTDAPISGAWTASVAPVTRSLRPRDGPMTWNNARGQRRRARRPPALHSRAYADRFAAMRGWLATGWNGSRAAFRAAASPSRCACGLSTASH
jgi:cyclohexadieny/prephenate dehydrogenase